MRWRFWRRKQSTISERFGLKPRHGVYICAQVVKDGRLVEEAAREFGVRPGVAWLLCKRVVKNITGKDCRTLKSMRRAMIDHEMKKPHPPSWAADMERRFFSEGS